LATLSTIQFTLIRCRVTVNPAALRVEISLHSQRRRNCCDEVDRDVSDVDASDTRMSDTRMSVTRMSVTRTSDTRTSVTRMSPCLH
jgi:hypothetical protein